MTNTDWTIQQTKDLFELCEKEREKGASLSSAFCKMAEKTGRSVNSVRNYYYSQAKTFELVPEIAKKMGIRTATVRRETFVPFEEREVKKLMETVLENKSRGKSVRASIFELANGDAKVALRLQNKYRSILRSHRSYVEQLMADMKKRGIPYKDPYIKEPGTDNFARLTEYIASLDESKVGDFLTLIRKLT